MRKIVIKHSKLSIVAVVVAVLVFGMVGIRLLHSSRAATPFISAEPETSAITAPAASTTDTTASGGKSITFKAPSSGYLPFVMPAQSVLKASSKKVFGHYFPPYPISFDNKDPSSDYYANGYLNPNGESGKHTAYGGLLRERPLPRPISTSSTWALDDMKLEVKRASNAGLDGFTVDWLGSTGDNWTRMNTLIQAAPLVDPNFKIVLMPDAGGDAVKAGPGALAAATANLENTRKSSLYHLPDGRLVISPYRAEAAAITLPNNIVETGARYWEEYINILKTQYGINIALVPCFSGYNAGVATSFAPISYGFGDWGGRSPKNNMSLSTNINDAHNRGKIWMQPVSLQDERPNGGSYAESNNTENFRLTWAGAIGGADCVQIPTWNDYSENAQISPSTHIGWSPLDINAYYLTQYKTGTAPTITKDVLYVSHRIQPYAAAPTGGQTKLMVLRSDSGPARDTVEIMSFLTAPATITVKVGSNTYTYNAPAGVFTQTQPLATGTVSATASRSGVTAATVTSPFPIVSAPAVQNLTYHFVSSARGNNGIGNWDD